MSKLTSTKQSERACLTPHLADTAHRLVDRHMPAGAVKSELLTALRAIVLGENPMGGWPSSALSEAYQDGFAEACRIAAGGESQRVCAHCQTQIIPSGLTECPKCDKPVMP